MTTKLREILEQTQTWKLVTKSVDGKVIQFTLTAKSKDIKPARFEIYGMISVLKE